ncbi:FG-GAP repeat domain-containing protein [Pseudooceanicola algae]|uniref:Uncharacterized protein n=1 Tax=Pseudooceanicola algae TaxID=1537215 RepID=A0A418SEZ1_9RHOB|nr:VCBS repeat-containing protein [Pseudooceanicola algae]QPM89030.1 hypothetical protein PSAL_002390 [Pseudooceanicola algae]
MRRWRGPPARGARRQPARTLQRCARRAMPVVCLVAAALLLPCPATATEIHSARFAGPTERYRHGILGDEIEFSMLEISLSEGPGRRFTLPETLVFEDVAPRLLDVDGDGTPEILVVESSLTGGARLTVWDETGRIAATPHIGRSQRWLAPIGAADLDGDGRIEIAYIDRPHLAKTLRIWRFDGDPADGTGQLTEIASAPGYSNHQIGWSFIPGGIRHCDGVAPEMILADGNWQHVVAVTLDADGQLNARELSSYAGPQSLSRGVDCP